MYVITVGVKMMYSTLLKTEYQVIQITEDKVIDNTLISFMLLTVSTIQVPLVILLLNLKSHLSSQKTNCD